MVAVTELLRSAAAPPQRPWTGAPVERKEDDALLTGNARFIDDMEPVAGLAYAAILRSPHAHARIASIDTTAAAALPGVVGVATGARIAEILKPIASVIRSPIVFHPCAVGKARYIGPARWRESSRQRPFLGTARRRQWLIGTRNGPARPRRRSGA
jgi:xanthine dehydrogenase molybdopterin-binding subunit B